MIYNKTKMNHEEFIAFAKGKGININKITRNNVYVNCPIFWWPEDTTPCELDLNKEVIIDGIFFNSIQHWIEERDLIHCIKCVREVYERETGVRMGLMSAKLFVQKNWFP